ncbi:MAG TPA: dienelactone hydrolase family protein [Casimicrobiaceae bacterium]|nr:dienelactone hydrolase family protein [Casimicrobiaceae bacterium]
MAAQLVSRRALCCVALAVTTLAAPALAAVPAARNVETVTFPSIDRDAAGRNVALKGFVLLPRTPAPPGGYPAVIALHGCGGLHSMRRGHEQELAERLALRADRYLSDGFAVLFPDSFGPRGVREVCTIRIGDRTVTSVRRRLDALGALAYLAHRSDIAAQRIALVGWSHGGSTVLYAINARDPDVMAFAATPGAPTFRAAVAFYPGCRGPLRAGERWEPVVPTRIHVGELDDWTPAQPCVELGRAVAARGADFDVQTYPGSYHAFDSPTGRVMHRDDVPNGVHPGSGVTVGPNPQARAVANVRVRAFLRDRLAP